MQLLNFFWVDSISSWFYMLEYLSFVFVIPSGIWLFYMEYEKAKKYIGVARLVLQYFLLKSLAQWLFYCLQGLLTLIILLLLALVTAAAIFFLKLVR